MQQLSNQDMHIEHAAVCSSRKRKTSVRRKVTVRLSEPVCGRLDVATDRPGVGKSMLVEAAIDQFLNPATSAEALLREGLEEMRSRFDHLERDMRMISETVALHTRYQMAVMPPIPQSRQREAIVLGDERFKILAEQVDRRIRERRPLLQETIDRLNTAHDEQSDRTTGERPAPKSTPPHNGSGAAVKRRHVEQAPAASESNKSAMPGPSQATKAAVNPVKALSDRAPNAPASLHSDPKSSTWRPQTSNEESLSKWRLVLSVFLPFAAGYYLSFLFRTINASISPMLASDFGLDAAETGLLASVYFLVFAGVQIPIGVLLDRYGPRRVQSVLLILAVGGATLFGNADSFAELLVGRALIGLGVAASLMAGLKAIVTWFPKERVALLNGCMIMLGSLGAVTATAPTDWLLTCIGWRCLFQILTLATLFISALIYFVVPERDELLKSTSAKGRPLTLRSIFTDPRFLRIVPLSAACVGSSWALQSLWAASWLADVEGFDRPSVINQLFMMAMGISVGALGLGTMADRLRRWGISAEVLLAVVGGLFILAELALVLRVPMPSILPWSVVSIVGAGTVLSYAIIAEYFPVEIAARANGALNLLHFGWAFIAQFGIGLVVEQWTPKDGRYPIDAYQAAFGLGVMLQLVALAWFATPWLRILGTYIFSSVLRPFASHGNEADWVEAAVEAPIIELRDKAEW